MSATISLPYFEEGVLNTLIIEYKRTDAQTLVLENMFLIEQGWNQKKFCPDVAREIHESNPFHNDPEPITNLTETVQQSLNLIEAKNIITSPTGDQNTDT